MKEKAAASRAALPEHADDLTRSPGIKPAYLPFATRNPSGADQLDGVAQRRLHSDAREDSESLITHVHVLFLTAEAKANVISLHL